MLKNPLKKQVDTLHKKTANWNNTGKILFLVVVYISIGGSCIYCITHSQGISNSIQKLFNHSRQITPVSPPFSFTDSFELLLDTSVVNRFNRSLDSLRRSDSGRKKIEAFQQTRPGFLDSVRKAESLFNHYFIP